MYLIPKMVRCTYMQVTSPISPHHDDLSQTKMTSKRYVSHTKEHQKAIHK